MRRRFDGVLIDFYGTVSAGDRDAVARVCRRIVDVFGLDMTPVDFSIRWGEQFFAVIAQSNHESFRSLYECEVASLQRTFSAFRMSADPAPFVTELESYWANPPVHADALSFLREIDLPTCCVSNADTAPLVKAMEARGLRFDAVVTSEEARCYKPDRKIFDLALERLGIQPARAVHIGDSLHSDIAGAFALGITTVWVKRTDRIHDIGTVKADHEIASLDRAVPIIRSIVSR